MGQVVRFQLVGAPEEVWVGSTPWRNRYMQQYFSLCTVCGLRPYNRQPGGSTFRLNVFRWHICSGNRISHQQNSLRLGNTGD